MIYALYFIHILISIFLILVVLLQQGKGADLSVFGGGGTQVAFGARSAATILHKLTVACFVLFLITTLTLGIMSARSAPSVMSGVETGEDAAADDLTEPPGGSLDEASGPAGGTLDDDGAATTDAASSDDASSEAAGDGEAAGDDGSTDDGTSNG